MLRWFTGEARSAAADKPINNEEAIFEEPPDTPAPLFAVRAFKTAIFGTPHHYSTLDDVNNQRSRSDKAPIVLSSAHRTSSVSEERNGISAKPRSEAFPSPTKGILLTPGTGAARRKSVSFGTLANNWPNDGQEQAQHVGGPRVSSEHVPNALISYESCAMDHRSASFKSKLEVADQLHDAEEVPSRAAQIPKEDRTSDSKETDGQDAQGMERTDGDITIDLDTPRSKSGKYWKAEYERYSKRSDREMKKVIQLSQTAKSYAAKKDVEAANLDEMLNEELSRTAAMEAKVTVVASQLAKHAAQGLGGTPDEQKLVSDLAKQTALALRYKHKADRCRTALNRQTRPTRMGYDGDTVAVHSIAPEDSEIKFTDTKVSMGDGQDWISLRNDLRDMKERAQNAELKSAELEKENSALKANLIRVKGEIDKYEARRKEREENQQKREAKLESQRDEYKALITQLTTENESLRLGATLKVDGSVPNSLTRPLAQLSTASNSDDRDKVFGCPQSTEMNGPGLQGQLQNSHRLKTNVEEHIEALRSQEPKRKITEVPSEDQPPIEMSSKHDRFTVSRVEKSRGSGRSPRRRAPKPGLDIWTMIDKQGMPENGVASPQALPDDSSNEAGIVKSSEETNEALREISRNVIEEQQNSSDKNLNRSPNRISVSTDPNRHMETVSPKTSTLENPEIGTSSAIRRMHERRSFINSPRPSMLSFIASPRKDPDTGQPLAGLNLTDHRSTSNTASSLRRNTSTISTSTRINSMARIRPHTGMSNDRILAAKLRLASKRKLQENQKPEA